MMEIIKVDALVNNLFYVFRDPATVKIFFWITLLGEIPTVIIFALVASSLLWLYRKKRQIIALWLAVIGSEGMTFLTKIIFHRPRPTHAVFLENSGSFPSGHATIAVAFYGFIAYLLLRETKNKKYRVLIVITCALVILGLGLSRLYLGVHYLSDVLAGYLVGLLWLIVSIGISEQKLFSDHS